MKGFETKNTLKRIQIYRERCSGTIYLEYLLKKNSESIQIRWNFGWKHFLHGEGVEHGSDCLFIVIYRNLFDWLRSLRLIPFHVAPELRSIGFSDFIRKEWWCIWDEQAGKSAGEPMKYQPKVYDPITPEDMDYILHEIDPLLEENIGYNVEALAAGQRSALPAASIG